MSAEKSSDTAKEFADNEKKKKKGASGESEKDSGGENSEQQQSEDSGSKGKTSSTVDKGLTAEQAMLDEPDDELEEFDEIGGNDGLADPEVAQWDENWDVAGWDDEDVNDEFIQELHRELEAFKNAYPPVVKQTAQTGLPGETTVQTSTTTATAAR